MNDAVVDSTVSPPECFLGTGPNAQWSSAAVVMALGAELAGIGDNNDVQDLQRISSGFELGDTDPVRVDGAELSDLLGSNGLGSVVDAMYSLRDSSYFQFRIIEDLNQFALVRLWRQGELGDLAALVALVRACTFHQSEPIRVCASASWLAANPGDDQSTQVLASSIDSESETCSAISRTLLETSGFDPGPDRIEGRAPSDPILSKYSLMIHGTWAYDKEWWRPAVGDFHSYIRDQYRANLWSHPSTYYWSGRYRNRDRDFGTSDLGAWTLRNSPAGLDTVFAHSYGGHVALYAINRGLSVDQIIFLSVPFFEDDREALEHLVEQVPQVHSLRTERDLVLFADRVARRASPSWIKRHWVGMDPIRPPFPEHFVGHPYTGHSATHDRNRWTSGNWANLVGLIRVV
jgi:hypothetical protein